MKVLEKDYEGLRESGFKFLNDFIPEEIIKVFRGVFALYEVD